MKSSLAIASPARFKGSCARMCPVAAEHSLSWAIDLALSTVQGAIGEPRWAAAMPALPRGGLAHVHQQGRTHYLRHVAIAKELGPVAGAQYFVSRVTPGRFLNRAGRFDWRATVAWGRSVTLRARYTPWSGSVLDGIKRRSSTQASQYAVRAQWSIYV